MARDSDNLARSFEIEDAGGLMTGFLAEEDQFDRRSLWRLGSWGVGAIGAVIVAVLAHQSSIGLRREQIANADLARQSQQIQSIAKESQHETRRLASAIDTLNGDRDRLYSRITVLEQGLDSMTGSITRQTVAAGSPQATPQSSSIVSSSIVSSSPVSSTPGSSSPVLSSTLPSPPVVPSTTTSASPPASAPSASASSAPGSLWPASPAKAEPPVTQSAAPAVAPVATAAAARDAAMPDKPLPVGVPSEPASVIAAPPTRPMASNASAATPATPLMPAKSIMAPPDAAAGKLIAPDTPPDTVATAPDPGVVTPATSPDDAKADDVKADDEPAASTVQRTEFAVDVGTANSVGGLRALWRGLLKSKSNAALATLRPIIVVKESNNGSAMQLRLVAGPLGDAAAAAKICAAMLEGKRATCETTVFDGQQLALKDDEPQASAKPAPVRPAARRRSLARRVMTVEPPKPQPTTMSSFFSR
jgi:hypothetical protein